MTNCYNAKPALRFSCRFSTNQHCAYQSVTVNAYLQLFYLISVIGPIKSTCSILPLSSDSLCALYEGFHFCLTRTHIFHTKKHLYTSFNFAISIPHSSAKCFILAQSEWPNCRCQVLSDVFLCVSTAKSVLYSIEKT